MSSTSDRDIRFFRVDTGDDSSGKPKLFNPIPFVTHIDRLTWTKGERYWDDNGKITGCWIYSKEAPVKLALGSIRRTDLPQIETLGEVSALEIPERAGLVEQTHIVFFENNIAGCDINAFGPRISRLPYYLSQKAFGIAPDILHFHPILRRDVRKQLQKLKFLRKFTLRVRAPYVDTIARSNQNLADAFRAALRVGETDDVEVTLRVSKKHKGWLANGLLETTRELMENLDLQVGVSKFEVNGYNEDDSTSVLLNLLNATLITKRAITKAGGRSRALNPKSAFNAIISAYEELKEEILQSASLEM